MSPKLRKCWKKLKSIKESDNRNPISISAESRESADKLINGLSSGGKVEMPISDGLLGSYFGMFADE